MGAGLSAIRPALFSKQTDESLGDATIGYGLEKNTGSKNKQGEETTWDLPAVGSPGD